MQNVNIVTGTTACRSHHWKRHAASLIQVIIKQRIFGINGLKKWIGVNSAYTGTLKIVLSILPVIGSYCLSVFVCLSLFISYSLFYATTYHRPSGNWTGYRSTRGSTTSCACWSIRRWSGRRRRTSPTCWHLSPVSSHWALSAQPPTSTTSCPVPVSYTHLTLPTNREV